MTSAEFWRSPIALPKPPIAKSARFESKAEKDQLPEPIETREEQRDGRTFKVTVLPGFTGRAEPLPERPSTVGNYEVSQEGGVRQLRPTGTEDY